MNIGLIHAVTRCPGSKDALIGELFSSLGRISWFGCYKDLALRDFGEIY
jgi:hypothetical protein